MLSDGCLETEQSLHELTLSIVAEGHSCLSQTNCVFALCDAIEFLELGLVNALDVFQYMVDHDQAH